MKAYEEALFGAFVGAQAVEEQARELVLRYDQDGRLQLTDRQRKGVLGDAKNIKTRAGDLFGALITLRNAPRP